MGFFVFPVFNPASRHGQNWLHASNERKKKSNRKKKKKKKCWAESASFEASPPAGTRSGGVGRKEFRSREPRNWAEQNRTAQHTDRRLRTHRKEGKKSKKSGKKRGGGGRNEAALTDLHMYPQQYVLRATARRRQGTSEEAKYVYTVHIYTYICGARHTQTYMYISIYVCICGLCRLEYRVPLVRNVRTVLRSAGVVLARASTAPSRKTTPNGKGRGRGGVKAAVRELE